MEYLKTKLELVDGIKSSKIEDKIAKKVTKFYTNKPFPNYKIDDDKITISKKGNNNYLASKFKDFVGYNKNVLEVGCGTGQLSIYFSTGNNNQIVSLDATLESLKVAKNFADKNNINNIEFVNIDILDDVLVEHFFDFIWCNGVLHHTKDPYKSFCIISKSLKKEGFNFNEDYIIMEVPNIVDISYGRGVGYTFTEHDLGEEIHEISATKIREQLRKDGKI